MPPKCLLDPEFVKPLNLLRRYGNMNWEFGKLVDFPRGSNQQGKGQLPMELPDYLYLANVKGDQDMTLGTPALSETRTL